MNIKQCQVSDLPACASILCEVYAQPPYNEIWKLEHAINYLQRFYNFDPSLCFVACDNDRIMGAIFSYSYPWQDTENCYIQEIIVSPNEQGKQVGQSLIKKLTQEKIGTSTWLVANENAKAVEFYKN